MTYKVIIAGGRCFRDLKMLTKVANHMLSNKGQNVTIVSGTANGADRLGEVYAYSKGFGVHRMPADWNQHGRMAGIIRNEEMAEFCDAAIIFWNGTSSGTKNMIENMEKIGKPHIVKRYVTEEVISKQPKLRRVK